jgi:hypothetical protein
VEFAPFDMAGLVPFQTLVKVGPSLVTLEDHDQMIDSDSNFM